MKIETAGALLRAESRGSVSAIRRGAVPAASARLDGDGGESSRRGDGLDSGSERACVPLCVCVCVRVVHWMRVPVFTGAGETSAPRSAGAASGARQGQIVETRHSEGEPHMHTHTHTEGETCYTLHRRNTEYRSRKQILAWIAVCWQKEGKAPSAPKTSSSPQIQPLLAPKLQIAC